jgi:hypothetical protein
MLKAFGAFFDSLSSAIFHHHTLQFSTFYLKLIRTKILTNHLKDNESVLEQIAQSDFPLLNFPLITIFFHSN